MNPATAITVIAIAFLACSLVGCAATTPSPAPIAVAESQPVKPPYLYREAPLPDGFPAPGPVDQVIIKQYPACRMATVDQRTPGGTDQDGMFWPLFKHIKKERIAMTAPVSMEYAPDDSGSQHPISMAFVYGRPDIGHTGADGAVRVIDIPPMTVVSMGVRGSYSESNFARALSALEEFLAANRARYEKSGPPRYLGYNSPFVPWFMRLGEVQIPVKVIQ